MCGRCRRGSTDSTQEAKLQDGYPAPLRNREFGQLVNEARRLIRSEDQYSIEVLSAEAMRMLTTDLHHGASRSVESTEINPGEPS